MSMKTQPTDTRRRIVLTLSPSPPPHPFLLASSEVNLASPEALLASLEALSISLEALCSVFIVFLFNNCIDHSLSVNLPFNGIIGSSFSPLLEIFGFDFFQNQIYVFRKAISIHGSLHRVFGCHRFCPPSKPLPSNVHMLASEIGF
jgi:hypothetical protein